MLGEKIFLLLVGRMCAVCGWVHKSMQTIPIGFWWHLYFLDINLPSSVVCQIACNPGKGRPSRDNGAEGKQVTGQGAFGKSASESVLEMPSVQIKGLTANVERWSPLQLVGEAGAWVWPVVALAVLHLFMPEAESATLSIHLSLSVQWAGFGIAVILPSYMKHKRTTQNTQFLVG